MDRSYNPFTANIEPLDYMDTMQLMPLAVRRSMMWDMVGDSMVTRPEDFGETPASHDVLEREYQDMVARHQAMASFGPSIDMACNLATTAAVKALTVNNPTTSSMSEEDLEKLTQEHMRVATMVTKSVIGQMLSKGLIHMGAQV